MPPGVGQEGNPPLKIRCWCVRCFLTKGQIQLTLSCVDGGSSKTLYQLIPLQNRKSGYRRVFAHQDAKYCFESEIYVSNVLFLLSLRCRSELFCGEQGDPRGGACEHWRGDSMLLHLPGRDVAHSSPGHLWTASQAHPEAKRPHRTTHGWGEQEKRGESVHSQTGCDTMMLSIKWITWCSVTMMQSPHSGIRLRLLVSEELPGQSAK